MHLIGRSTEQAYLAQTFEALAQGVGGMLLLSGEAGVGKSYLLEAVLAERPFSVLATRCNAVATPPYGPISAVLRAHLRTDPQAAQQFGPLGAYLALLLPELGPAPAQSDSALLCEALCQALLGIAHTQPSIVLIDDLQWADNATLELLPNLVAALAHEPLLVLGVYRDDELGRGHPIRQLRQTLRRAHLLRELVLEPFDLAETSQLLASLLDQSPSPQLAHSLYQHTDGLPLFIVELSQMLQQQGRLVPSQTGLTLQAGTELPIPESLQDAVLLRLDQLPSVAVRLLQLASVAGHDLQLHQLNTFDSNAELLDWLCDAGFIVQHDNEHARFRHTLVREAIYATIPWGRRQLLHSQFAQHLANTEAASLVLAQHWLAAKQPEAARQTLIKAAQAAHRIHAYRDAADAAQIALELWPSQQDEAQRLELLELLGDCAQCCGHLAQASQAWRELADARLQAGDLQASAQAESKIAQLAGLQGHWQQALVAHSSAAQAFSSCGMYAEAANELLVAATHERSAGHFRAAQALLHDASKAIAHCSQRPDLNARILGLQGNVQVRMENSNAGLNLVHQALSLALSHNLASVAAEIYQRLADSLEHIGDYPAATASYDTAFEFCQTHQLTSTAQICMACLTAVLRQTGEWERAISLCREVLVAPDSSLHALTVASSMLGTVYVLRGQSKRAPALLAESAALAQLIELAAMELMSAWGQALLYEQQGNYAAASDRCRFLLACWQQIEDQHYIVPALRWCVSYFASQYHSSDVYACANALTQIANKTGQAEALSALAHALGEIALLNGDAEQAVRQFEHALELIHDLNVPYCYCSTQVRAGQANQQAGRPEIAYQHLNNAYRIARKLGARPLAKQIAHSLKQLVPQQSDTQNKLTRRQLQILQLLAQGQTNHTIAQNLVLSPRTVEMHVANILTALDSRSRAEAVARAAGLGLLKNTV